MTGPLSEFSRPVALDALHDGSVRRTIEATGDECRRLAERLGLAEIESLSATVTLDARKGGKVIVVQGTFDAVLTQTCVVTLDPLRRTVSESFTERLAVAADTDEAVVDIDPDAEDAPEPIDGDSIDIGELVAQNLLLALDPYPRAEGAQIEPDAMSAGGAGEDGPFAKLARLKPKGR